jgi:hypothetical protein
MLHSLMEDLPRVFVAAPTRAELARVKGGWGRDAMAVGIFYQCETFSARAVSLADFQHGEHEGHTEVHGDWRRKPLGSPMIRSDRFRRFARSAISILLRDPPWILRVLRVENAVANPPPPIPVGTLIVAVQPGLTSVEVSPSAMIARTI